MCAFKGCTFKPLLPILFNAGFLRCLNLDGRLEKSLVSWFCLIEKILIKIEFNM